MANVTFPVWWVSAIPAQYSGSGTITASRAATSSTATITASLTLNYIGGDWLSHTAHMRIGSGTAVTAQGAGGIHYEGTSETFTLSQTISAADAGGSVTVYVWFTSDGYEGEPSSTQSASVSYPGRSTYTISYNANGGSGAPASQTKYHGTNITLSSTRPTRSGYAFSKWTTAANGTGTAYNPGQTYSANASVTLYAQWTRTSFTVSYNANGGSGAPASQTKYSGTTLTLSSTRPTRSGYEFNSWNTSANGSGTRYYPGGSYNSNASVTLYAQWTPKYTLSFHANGGSGAPASISSIAGNNITIPSTRPTKASTTSTVTVTYDKVEDDATISKSSETVTITTSYSFVKWNTNANGTGTSYSPGQSYKMPAGNSALYAIYSSGQSGSTQLPTGTRDQYVLAGWTESLTDITMVSNPFSPRKNVTLHAVWAPQSPGGWIKIPSAAGLTGVSKGSRIFLTGFHDKKCDGPYTVDSYKFENGFITMTFVEDFPSAGNQDCEEEHITIYGAGNWVPDFDYICSLNNRLWGCSSDLRTIYASALGDPTDFWTFAGDSLDAYQVAVGSSGRFTGMCAMNNNVLISKQHTIHKMVGNYPAEYALYTYDADGTSETNGLSAVNCDGIVIYVGEHGVATYSGSQAGTLSKDLGEGNMRNGSGMFNGEKYFLHYTTDDQKHRTYVFDTRYNVWVELDYKEVIAFSHLDDHDYALIRDNEGTALKFISDGNVVWDNSMTEVMEFYDTDDQQVYDSSVDSLQLVDAGGSTLYPIELFYGTVYQIDSEQDTDGDWEIIFKPFYENVSGNWGSTSHVFEKKRYTGVTFRLELPKGSWIKAEVKADDGRWIPVARKAGTHNGVDSFVIRTSRLDRMQLRLTGFGPMTILGMEREYTIGSRR